MFVEPKTQNNMCKRSALWAVAGSVDDFPDFVLEVLGYHEVVELVEEAEPDCGYEVVPPDADEPVRLVLEEQVLLEVLEVDLL